MAQIITHGTLDYAEIAELGYKPEDLIVFSSNINPYGPPPAVVDALRAATAAEFLGRYPDRLSLDLRRELAAAHAVPPEAILVGNGTSDIMWLIALLFMRRKRVAIVAPTFGEYENVATLAESRVTFVSHPGWRRTEHGRFAPAETTLADSCDALRAAAPEVVFICNPNNPTAHLLTPEELAQLQSAAPDALWVVDEAYSDFTERPWSVIEWIAQDGANDNWLVLRSMTKDVSLGGLRLGYAVATPARIERMQKAQPPWNVNCMAQRAGQVVMQHLDWRAESLARLRQDTADLRQALADGGFEPLPTATNYFLLPVSNATEVRSALLRKRLMVRDCTSFGLPQYIRIATQLPEQNRLLAEVLVKFRARAKPHPNALPTMKYAN